MERLSSYLRSLRRGTTVVVAVILTASCHGDRKGATGAGADSTSWISIDATSMQSGFARGFLRPQRTLPTYDIGKTPVTWGEFNACVQSGQCAKPEVAACPPEAYAGYSGYRLLPYDQKADDAPATCVGARQAESYCGSIGGRLPTLDEWLLAARGASPTRFSWGDSLSSVDQHPLAADLLARQSGSQSNLAPVVPGPRPVADVAELAVGRHPAGASPSGIEDVLLTPAELIASDANGLFSACAVAGSHCLVYGVDPAAIDAVSPFYRMSPTAADVKGQAPTVMVTHAYGFRCVTRTSHEVAQ